MACQPATESTPNPAAALQGHWQSGDLSQSIRISDYTIELLERGAVVDVTDIEIIESCADPEPSDQLTAFRYESRGSEVCFDILSVAEDRFTVVYERQGLEKTYRRI